MAAEIFEKLTWLLPPPGEFSAQCRALQGAPAGWERDAVRLANYGLDTSQLTRLARAIESAKRNAHGNGALARFKLGIISNSTTDLLVPGLVATALRYGLSLECVVSDYGQVMQTALDPDAPMYQAGLDAVLISLDYRAFPFVPSPGDAEAAAQNVERGVRYLREISRSVAKHSGATVIVCTLARAPEPIFGSLDHVVPGTLRTYLDKINDAIGEMAHAREVVTIDISGVADIVGLAEWHDPVCWHVAKQPFAIKFIPIYAEQVCRVLAALKGLAKRVLVLDLDNTLWGGVIGDDGLEGIRIGAGDPVGEAHAYIQATALQLRNRGIVLAVSSKNDDANARQPFREHPDVLLKEEHFAAFQANWQDKASNIRAIASELNLGLCSFVFLDDNPAERQLVRDMLPEVSVPELPDDPSLYVRTLLAAGYFDVTTFSLEDRQRAEFYQGNKLRGELLESAGDLDGFLRSLEMRIIFRPFDALGRARISQLINKSNQYNLTTRRYSEAQVEKFAADPSCVAMQVRLIDKFGDNGMISVVICWQEGSVLMVDTWLMSCRVLRREVERAVLQELVRVAKLRGGREIVGEFIPSGRNDMVRDHYLRLGFKRTAQDPCGRTLWSLLVADYVPQDLPMTFDSAGLEVVSIN